MGRPKKNHLADAAAADEDHLETKDEGELVSIATVKQMLDVQQSMLKTLLDSFISTVNARVDKLADSVASLKASLEFTQKDVADLLSLKSKLVSGSSDLSISSTSGGRTEQNWKASSAEQWVCIAEILG